MNSWTNVKKTILEKGVPKTFSLYINPTTPELVCDVINQTAVPSTTQTTVLTRSFPLQRWTHVLIGFDSNVLDCYLDGKLVTSVPLTHVLVMDATDNILGGSGADIFMVGFIKNTSKATADTANSEFNQSKSRLQTDVPNYNVDVSLIKNGEVAKKFSIM